jgi:putative FmdB family regulatory protein
MPIFEFHCRQCGSDFEELVAAFGDLALCPGCGSERVAKQVSSFAVAGEARQAGGNACGCGGSCSGGCSGGSCSCSGSGCHCH